MKCNMGNRDRIIRFFIGITILAAGAGLGCWWAWLGLIPIVTATIGWCPAYLPFGISSCKVRSDD